VVNKGSDLPDALLEAVDEALRSGGASALSLRDVARRAGVSHAAPAHHFGSKTGLLTAFAARGYRRLGAAVLEEVAAAGPRDGPSTLAAVGRGYVRFAVREPACFDVMFRIDALDASSRELVDATDQTYQLLVDTIELCRLEGYLQDRDPALVAIAAWSIVHGLATLWISGWLEGRAGGAGAEELAAQISKLFVEAVLPPQPGSAGTGQRTGRRRHLGAN
jgi:AcrR family transcriptional regulator